MSSRTLKSARKGIARANKTLKNVTGAWIKSQKIEIQNGKIREYRVDLSGLQREFAVLSVSSRLGASGATTSA